MKCEMNIQDGFLFVNRLFYYFKILCNVTIAEDTSMLFLTNISKYVKRILQILCMFSNAIGILVHYDGSPGEQ